jgi:hypothetical protein
VAQLKSTALAFVLGLWETAGMFKVGEIVLAKGYGNTAFKITELMHEGRFAAIQGFSVSKQVLLEAPTLNVPANTLTPLKEDASQAAARIVREATDQK